MPAAATAIPTTSSQANWAAGSPWQAPAFGSQQLCPCLKLTLSVIRQRNSCLQCWVWNHYLMVANGTSHFKGRMQIIGLSHRKQILLPHKLQSVCRWCDPTVPGWKGESWEWGWLVTLSRRGLLCPWCTELNSRRSCQSHTWPLSIWAPWEYCQADDFQWNW